MNLDDELLMLEDYLQNIFQQISNWYPLYINKHEFFKYMMDNVIYQVLLTLC